LNVADLDLRDLVPHSGPMLLIDELISANDQYLEAACTVRNDGLFTVSGDRIPAMVAVEYMAQAVAAFAGVRATLRGEPIKPGLLLGARNFTSSAAYLSPGERLRIAVALVIESANGLAVFDCEITGADLHAGARLTVITTNSLDDLGATT
jgi:predicted hotdog family 3-hydroxylacyl-ACP dehydratase